MKNRLRTYTFALLLSFLFVACGGGSGSISDTQSFTLAEKNFVHNLFTTEYLWYDEVPLEIDYDIYETPDELVDGLKVSQDRWSFSITKNDYEDYVNQKTAGFGFRYTDDFNILLVRIDAPAYNKLFRGDKILEINGNAVTSENLDKASKNLNVESHFKLLRGTDEIDVTITPREYTFKVTSGKTIVQNGKKIGYMSYDSFTSTSVNEFEAQFNKFKKDNITDIVVDLRYNGGGSINVASILLENLTNQYAGRKQFYLDWNENYKNNNSSYYFSDEVESNDLNMKRVIFLVTKNTASASELVISALKPYLGDANVVTIGDVTHGKPVGMQGRSYESNYYFLINFFVRNSANETTSLNGISVTCKAEDDISHLRGDVDETMLKTALAYINHNYSCP